MEIKKDMTFGQVLNLCPDAAGIMMKHGMHCVGCPAAQHETLEQGCQTHGISEEEMEDMIKEMNALIGGSKEVQDGKGTD